MSDLLEIKETAQKVAEAISSILNVEVEILDNEHYRVGVTGSVHKLGPKQQWGYVNEYVLKTRQHFILTNPGKHQICKVCELKDNCYCKVGIFCPIDYKDQCIGIINLMGFNDEQKSTLVAKSEIYMEFLMNMASLLSIKVSEQQTLKKLTLTTSQLDTIVNTLPYGIVAVDDNGNITCFNKEASNILGINSNEAISQTGKDIMPKSSFMETMKTGKEIQGEPKVYQVGDKRKTLYCSAYPIQSHGKIIGAIETFRDYRELQRLAHKINEQDHHYTFDDIISVSESMKKIKEHCRRAAKGFSTVLIEGESGTGKELFARAIHYESPFFKGPFVAINCSAIPDTLLESELFGYDSGAFTGARTGGKPGKFELADGGTLFLDEIGEMPIFLQAKMLRVLQDHVVERLGSTSKKPVNVRIVAATNRNLSKMVETGEFRDDLYYRLCVIPIFVPPLRDRQEDINVLLDYTLEKYSSLMNKTVKGFSPDVIEALRTYSWPGNVRELENTVEYAISFTEDEIIRLENLPARIRERINNKSEKTMTLQQKNLQLEKKTVEDLLNKYGTSLKGKDQVADTLGISRATLYRKIKQLKIKVSEK